MRFNKTDNSSSLIKRPFRNRFEQKAELSFWSNVVRPWPINMLNLPKCFFLNLYFNYLCLRNTQLVILNCILVIILLKKSDRDIRMGKKIIQVKKALPYLRSLHHSERSCWSRQSRASCWQSKLGTLTCQSLQGRLK